MKNFCANCGAKATGKFCSNCGLSLEDNASPTRETDDAIKALAKTLGIQEFVQVILSVHAPVRRIREFLAGGNPLPASLVTAYIELVTLFPFLQKEVILRLCNAIHLPAIAQGDLYDTHILFYLFAAIGSLLGLATVYLIPQGILHPISRPQLLAVNLQLSMYSVLYLFLSDFVKMLMWITVSSFPVVTLFGLCVVIAVTGFVIYVWRRVLDLRWFAVILLLVFGNVASFIQMFIVARAGLVHF